MTFCYSSNRKIENPFHISLSDFGGKVEKQLHTLNGFSNWLGIEYLNQSYLEHFAKEKLVYLSSESENTLSELDPNNFYIIGGLVDHNRLKGICLKKAKEQGIKTAKLPINDYMDLKSRKVLTINQVFDIIIFYSVEKNWAKAFQSVIPQRKGGTLRCSNYN